MSAVKQRTGSWFVGWNPYDTASLESKGPGIEPVVIESAPVMRTLVQTIVISAAAFMVWAVVAPLDSGVVVQGTVTVSGNRKAVQHPGGGVVQELLIREGSKVKQGEVLLRINPLNTEANLTSVELQYINLLATESRLLTERLRGADIRWKPELAQFKADDPRVIEAKQFQQQLFRSRAVEVETQRRILREQLVASEAQAISLARVLMEKRRQLETVNTETANLSQLAKEGYVPEATANSMARSQSSLQGDLAGVTAQIASNQSAQASTREQIAQLQNTLNRDIDNQLAEIQKNREAFQARLEAIKFDRGLTEVRAPASGTVVGLKANTVGGVIAPGQVLMEIVPEGSQLIVEAQTPGQSIDKVRAGMEAYMRFSAFNQRTTPVVPGIVRMVGADVLTDPKGEHYYLTQIETTPEGLELLGKNQIQPGMPVEVMVKNGERNFISYLLKPLTDRFARSFKEE